MIKSNTTYKEEEAKKLAEALNEVHELEKGITEEDLNELYDELVKSEEVKIELNPKKERDDDLIYTLLGVALAVGIVVIAIWSSQ